MMPEITVLPFDCTPLQWAGAPKKVSNLSGKELDVADDLGHGVPMSLPEGQDVTNFTPSPLVVKNFSPDYMDKFYRTQNSQYPKIFENIALGLEKDNRYMSFFASDVAESFGDYKLGAQVQQQLSKMVKEMRNNFEAGAMVDYSALQTKFTINDVEFSFNQLLKAKDTLEYSKNLIGGTGTRDYWQYADVGIAIGYTKNVAKGFSDEQGKMLMERVTTMADSAITATQELMQKSGWSAETNTQTQAFYGVNSIGPATNQEYIDKATNLFADIDFSDASAVQSAVSEYANMYVKVRGDGATNDRMIQKEIADKFKKIAGEKKYERLTVNMVNEQIADVERYKAARRAAQADMPPAVERPEQTIQDIRMEYAKNAYQKNNGKIYNSHAEQVMGEFKNGVGAYYEMLGKEYIAHEDWKDYYKSMLAGDDDLKARATCIGASALQGFAASIDSDYETLISKNLTQEEEAFAYRLYGDRFLQDKIAHHEKAQGTLADWGEAVSRQNALSERLMMFDLAQNQGEDFDPEEFKLSFKAYLHANGGEGFLGKLSIALEELGRKTELIEAMASTKDSADIVKSSLI